MLDLSGPEHNQRRLFMLLAHVVGKVLAGRLQSWRFFLCARALRSDCSRFVPPVGPSFELVSVRLEIDYHLKSKAKSEQVR